MTALATPESETKTRRPGSLRALVAVLTFLGITALGGGIEMLLFVDGNEYLPSDMLEKIPFDSFLIPGLVLGGIFGLGSLFLAWSLWRKPEFGWLNWVEKLTRRHWSWAGSVLMAFGFASWMVIEISLLGTPWEQADASGEGMAWVLYGIYSTVAAVLLVLPQLNTVKEHLGIANHDS